MTFLPVVERELRAAARRRGTFWTRVTFSIVAMLVVGIVLTFTGIFRPKPTGMGGDVLFILSVMAFGFALLSGVFLTADCLSEEKREGTLGLLFLTDLKGYDVVLGKLMATSLNAFYGLLAIFPVLAITLTLGGVTHGEFWRMVLVFLNALFLSLTSGLFVSSVSRQDNRAMSATFLLLLFIVGGLPLLELGLSKAGVAGPLSMSMVSPLTGFRLAFDGNYRAGAGSFWRSLLAGLLLGWTFLILASVLLPRLWQDGPRLNWTAGRQIEADGVELSKRATQRARLLDINPVYWLASKKMGPAWLWWLAFGLLAGLLLMLTLSSGPFRFFSWWIFLLLLPVRVAVGLQASRFFVEARRSGSLELLLCTPLTVYQILAGQWFALRRLFLMPVVMTVSVLFVPLSAAILSDPGNLTLPWFGIAGYLGSIATFIADVFAVAWVGMLLGLTCKKPSLAPGLTLFYAIVLPTLVVCIPGVLIDIPLIFWARDKLHRELRTLISQRYMALSNPLYAPAKPPPLFRG